MDEQPVSLVFLLPRAEAGVPEDHAPGRDGEAVFAQSVCEMGGRSPQRAPWTLQVGESLLGFLSLPQFSQPESSDWEILAPRSPTQRFCPSQKPETRRQGKGGGLFWFLQVAPAQINFSKFRKNKAASFCAFR